MSYNADIYREQGGKKLVVGSSGEIEIRSSGFVDVQDGGYIAYAAGAAFVQSLVELGTSQVATNVTGFGATTIVASTTAPAYTVAAPERAGQMCWVNVVQNTSSGTAVLQTSSTGVSISSTGANQITFNALEGVALIAKSTTGWRVALNGGAVTYGAQST